MTGREGELERLHSVVSQLMAGGTERHVLITGLRGVGKTVLLNEFEVICQEAGWPAETKEIGRGTSLSTLVGRSARKALLQMSARKRAGEVLGRALSVLKAFEMTVGDTSFKIDVEASVGIADSGDLIEDLRDLFVAVGEAAQEAGLGFALILDEVQNLSRDDYEALIMALHRAKQRRLPVAFVGAGLPLIPKLTAEAKSYAERMFVYPSIGQLPEPAAREALVKPAEQQGVSWDAKGVKKVLAYTEGYPYLIQEYGRRAWALNSGRQISLADTLAAKALVEADLDESFFEGRIGRLTNAERAYASAMAALGDGPQQSGQVAELLGRKQSSLSTVRDDLMRSAVIYSPRRGLVDFTVPHCAAYVRRSYPPETRPPDDSGPSKSG
ncbi:MAG TPA: ATP-binding protein [Solirubrobacteraceae bacterium]|nr:ATP-binding protein [Solirubrobacteraceae bacterium]